jgi:hypothetical protein
MPVPARLDRIEFVTDAAHVSISEYRCYSIPADIGRHREDHNLAAQRLSMAAWAPGNHAWEVCHKVADGLIQLGRR